jgi:hypothetical protein
MTRAELIAELERERQAAEVEDARVLKAPLLRRVITLMAELDGSDQATEPANDVIDAKEAAVMLGWTVRTVWAHSSEYPFARREGGRWKYSRSGIKRWITQHAA